MLSLPFLFSSTSSLSSSFGSAALSSSSPSWPCSVIHHYHFLSKYPHSSVFFFFFPVSSQNSSILNLPVLTLYFLVVSASVPSSPSWKHSLYSLSPLPHSPFTMQLTAVSFRAKQTEITLARVNNQCTCFNFYVPGIKAYSSNFYWMDV